MEKSINFQNNSNDIDTAVCEETPFSRVCYNLLKTIIDTVKKTPTAKRLDKGLRTWLQYKKVVAPPP